jgi:hypothetical protein
VRPCLNNCQAARNSCTCASRARWHRRNAHDMQGSNDNGAVYTMVWGTDINVNDVQRQFSTFVRGFRVQRGTDEDGVPVLAPEAKYMAYLKDVRGPSGHSRLAACHILPIAVLQPAICCFVLDCFCAMHLMKAALLCILV